MPRLTLRQIDEENSAMLTRQARFRIAAGVVTDALARFPEVERIALIGSVARPLWKEVPRFSEFRRERVEIWHECKDVDLAVWLNRLDRLRELNRARNLAAQGIHARMGFSVANHEVEIFLLEPGSDRYLGRLCKFAQCPKGKRACEVPGCGSQAFLQQYASFVFWPNTLHRDRSILLYHRDQGVIQRAADIPAVGQEPVEASRTSPSHASGAPSVPRRTTSR
jgi:hypothetical protein